MKILFICDFGEVRSRTVAEYYQNKGHEVGYAEVFNMLHFLQTINEDRINEYDLIICFKKHQYDILYDFIDIPTIILNIDDNYGMVGDDRIIEEIERQVNFFKWENYVNIYIMKKR